MTPPVVTNVGNIPYANYPTITGPRFTPTINKTGRQIISAPGTYSGWNVTAGNIDIQSNGGLVILEDFIVDARGTTAAGPVWVRNGFTSPVEIRYGRVVGAGNVGSTAVVTGVNGYVHNVDLSNSEDGFRPFTGSKIQANWVHSLYVGVGSHNDTLQLIGTEHDVDISQNRFDAPYRAENAAVFIKADVGNIDRINVHNNYMYGGGYSVYVYDALYKTTNVNLDYNVFVRGSCNYSQLVTLGTGLVSKVGNTWDDGSLIWG
ncbi:MAG: hypothetical protein ABI912_04425 [Actinomycetota bacterium]